MTIEEVLAQVREIYPDSKPNEIHINMDRDWYGNGKVRSNYYIFVPNIAGSAKRIWTSDRSWEHVIAQARANNEEVWPEVEEPIA